MLVDVGHKKVDPFEKHSFGGFVLVEVDEGMLVWIVKPGSSLEVVTWIRDRSGSTCDILSVKSHENKQGVVRPYRSTLYSMTISSIYHQCQRPA